CDFLAISKNTIAIIPAIIDTGIAINSLVKYPTNKIPKTNHEYLNSFLSFIASIGACNSLSLKCLGIAFLKYNHKTKILATSENRLGIIILPKYSKNPILK